MYLIVCTLCVFIVQVQSICEKTYTNECDKISDVQRYGLKNWKSLLISPNKCKKTTSHTLDEVLIRDAFNKTPSVEEVIVVEKITGIEAGAFNGIGRLDLVRFYKNQMTVIPRGAFAKVHIHKLDLSHNTIENIAHNFLEQSIVTVLDLSHNKLNNIQVNMLNLGSLERITIRDNHLQSFADGCFHENLQYLDLAFNSISLIQEGVLKPLKNLKELNLANNRIKGIEISYGMPSLVTLDLSHNEIQLIAHGSFTKFFELKRLVLSHNYLTSISQEIFPIGNSIAELFLSYNAFMYMPEATAMILPKLSKITIAGNPWACPCLNIVTGYIQEKNITQPECDHKYFSTGKSAICVVTGESCTTEEMLTQEGFLNFRGSLQQDLCEQH